MAITEVVARTPNLNNVHYEPSLEKDENGEFIQVPVPRGYVASEVDDERYVNGVTENGVRVHSGGFVIYEGTEPVTSTNLEEAQRTRNQYVWVPIPKEESVENKMYHISEGILYAKSYAFSATQVTNNVSEREPRLNPLLYSFRASLKKELEGISESELIQNMREEFYEMLVSVKTYGGFYIGRYETGNLYKKVPVIVRGNYANSDATWYIMYKTSKNLKGANHSVQTGLIWGILWDETLLWLMQSGEKTLAEINDSSSWGNIYGTSTPGAGSNRGTGYSELWKANNIYDLAGNVWELTMEGSLRKCGY